MNLSGPYFTVYTAFQKDGDIDYKSISNYINYLIRNGADKLYLMPYNGRYSQLSMDEILSLNRFVIKESKVANKETLVIVSDPIHCSTADSIKFAVDAKKNGADLFSSICREKFYSNEQIISHYEKLGDANIPIFIHNMPFLSATDSQIIHWPIDLVYNLSKLDHVFAMKEDTKDINYAKKLMELPIEAKLIFAGRKSYLLELIDLNIDGYLNGISMINPAISHHFWELYKNKKIKDLSDFVKKVDDPFWDVLVKRLGWHRCNKASLEYFKIMKRNERLPMICLSDDEFTYVSDFWDKHVNEINKCIKFVLYQQEANQKDS